VLRLRISGTAPLLPLYAFMACIQISLPLPLGMVLTIHSLLLRYPSRIMLLNLKEISITFPDAGICKISLLEVRL